MPALPSFASGIWRRWPSLFVQVLQLCERAGLVKLGHVAIDGSKIKANASKYRTMTYAGLSEAEQKLVAEVTRLLAEAERIDAGRR